MQTFTVEQLLDKKGNKIYSVESSDTVFSALQVMEKADIGGVLVVDDDQLVGVFTERDYARKIVLKKKFSRETTLAECMTKEILYIDPKNTIDECLALMSAKRVRHLPVIRKGILIGIVTIGDIIKEFIAQQEFIINNLEHYIKNG